MSDPNQTNAMISPNQAEFPIVLQIRHAKEIVTPEDIKKFPILQQPNMLIADVILDDKPIPGEYYELGWKRGRAHYKEVMASRPAKGDYSGPQFAGSKPTWYRCICEMEIVPA